MKMLWISVVVIASAFMTVGLKAERKHDGKSADEVILTQMENNWGEAVLKKDALALRKILADD